MLTVGATWACSWPVLPAPDFCAASLTHSLLIARTLQCPRAGRAFANRVVRRATAAVASDGGDACSNYPDRGSPKSSRGVAAPARSGKPSSLFESRTPWPLGERRRTNLSFRLRAIQCPAARSWRIFSANCSIIHRCRRCPQMETLARPF